LVHPIQEQRHHGATPSTHTHRLLDPPDPFALPLALPIGLLFLPRIVQFTPRREQQQHGLDGLWDECQEIRVEREEVLKCQWGFGESERSGPLGVSARLSREGDETYRGEYLCDVSFRRVRCGDGVPLEKLLVGPIWRACWWSDVKE
jgi:hypothetical protein